MPHRAAEAPPGTRVRRGGGSGARVRAGGGGACRWGAAGDGTDGDGRERGKIVSGIGSGEYKHFIGRRGWGRGGGGWAGPHLGRSHGAAAGDGKETHTHTEPCRGLGGAGRG